ncbi:MAG: MCE family protein [Proteobacteria bacterium]|nr:MCE family protein [Pseudomonadota bacterium]
MQKFSTPFKVGIVILIGLIVSTVMVVRFSVNWGQDNGVIELNAYFDDVTGLAVHSKVMVAGIQIGEVSDITLEGKQAHVKFKVRTDVPLYSGIRQDSFMKNGATVSKKMSSILGDYHLEITPGVEGDILKNNDKIENVLQTGGIDTLMKDAGKIMGDISQVTSTLASVLGAENGEQRLSSLLEDLNETMKNIKAMTDDNSQKIDAIISYVETITKNAAEITEYGNKEIPGLVNDVSDTLAELNLTLSTLRSGVGNTLDSTHDGIEQLRASIDKLDRTLASLETITKRIENGEGTVGKILKDDDIANEAQALLAETRDLIKSGSKTVDGANSLLKPITSIDVDVSLRGDYLVRANAFKVDFGVKLQPAFEKYYLLGLVMDPKGTTSTKTVMTDSSATGPVYETVTTNEDTVKFTAQYARRWRWFAGRFGIIENTGGLGGDVFLFNDDWRFSFDVFAFNDNKYPRVRGTTLLYLSLVMPESWTWAKTFYLSAGFDDPLNTNLFDYYFGIGFRFSDNDLKSIMTLVPKI